MKKINYNNIYLSFNNTNNNRIEIKSWEHTYHKISSFLELNNEVICVFDKHPKTDIPKQKKRRNVIKFDENGEILWRVADPYEKDDQSEDCFFEYIKTDFKGKVFLVGKNGDEYILNTDNGEINLH
jgi:hypothetical protein